MFVSILLFFFMLLSVLALMDTGEKKSAYTEYIYWGAIFLMFLLAAFRPIGVDHDSSSYENMFNNGLVNEFDAEFSFVLIGEWIYKVWQTPQMLFFIYALISVLFKAFPIKKISSEFYILAVLVWFSHFYMLQDLTQIRAAAAATFFLFGLIFLIKGKRLVYLAIILIAVFFHYSAIILLFLVILGNKELSKNWKIFLFSLPILGYIFYFIHFNPLIALPIPYISDKIEVYESLRDTGLGGDEINVFSTLYLMKLIMYYFVLIKYEHIKVHFPAISLILKIFGFSYFSYTFFAFLPVLSFRVSEMMGIVEIFMIPTVIYAVEPRFYGRCLAVLYASANVFLNVFYIELFDFNL